MKGGCTHTHMYICIVIQRVRITLTSSKTTRLFLFQEKGKKGKTSKNSKGANREERASLYRIEECPLPQIDQFIPFYIYHEADLHSEENTFIYREREVLFAIYLWSHQTKMEPIDGKSSYEGRKWSLWSEISWGVSQREPNKAPLAACPPPTPSVPHIKNQRKW